MDNIVVPVPVVVIDVGGEAVVSVDVTILLMFLCLESFGELEVFFKKLSLKSAKLVLTFKEDSRFSSIVLTFKTDSVVALILGLILDLSRADLKPSLL